ncbi:MAG TPA: DNA primase [Clostridiales bacterium]|jgi:DNA primase|nr:DNA primase [Clostridiales bacterium]
MIPREIIEEIKYRCDISDVIGQYVSLKRAGSNLVGLCPFHNERTPSFTVFLSSDSFYCFGCGAGGDVVTFIMKMESLSYIEAIEVLAKRCGITVPKEARERYRKTDEVSREKVLAMNLDAAKFFREQLNSTRAPMEYLLNRGYSPALIRRFGLGYAPNEFGALTGHMLGLGYSEKELSTAFLCGISKKNGKPYDYFRGRIIIPIIDTQKDVIAFGGRVLDNSMPKYLNTSDTPAFKKSRSLFALNYAKASCADELILCEGYMDVMALHDAGFTNSVATLGTAITNEHARIMKRYTKKVLIAYDVDEAGQRAADKAFRLFDEVGLEARVVRVRDAKDPDEYIKKFGPDRFRMILNEGSSRFDFQTENILKQYDINDPRQKIAALKEITSVIAAVYSSVERDLYIHKISEKLSVQYESLKNDVRNAIRRNRKKADESETNRIHLAAAGFGGRNMREKLNTLSSSSSEEAVLGMLLKYPEYAELIRNGEVALSAEDFGTDIGKRLYDLIINKCSGGEKPENFLNELFTPDEIGLITGVTVSRERLSNTEEIFRDCVSNLRSRKNGEDDGESASISDINDLINKKRQDFENNREE